VVVAQAIACHRLLMEDQAVVDLTTTVTEMELLAKVIVAVVD
jgi:uncharacterized membrane protein (DUF4010 family)